MSIIVHRKIGRETHTLTSTRGLRVRERGREETERDVHCMPVHTCTHFADAEMRAQM